MAKVLYSGELGDSEHAETWRENSLYLYDFAYSDRLEWPSLTVEWLPGSSERREDDATYLCHSLLLGTHTSFGVQNLLTVYRVELPAAGSRIVRSQEEELAPRMVLQTTLTHDGEVNRARGMPQSPNWVATKSPSGRVYLFDTAKRRAASSAPDSSSSSSTSSSGGAKAPRCQPDVTLTGHREEGFGLNWSPVKAGLLASGSQDGRVCLWDTSASPSASAKSLAPLHTLELKPSVAVNDVCFHSKTPLLLMCGCENGGISLWDLRESSGFPCFVNASAHRRPINSLACCPHDENTFVTGSSDRLVSLWDQRNLQQPLYSLVGHSDDVLSVGWSPQCPTHVASSGKEGRVFVWDLARIGAKQEAELAEGGPPELLFVHNGHEGEISDFSWHPEIPYALASVSTENALQIWRVASELCEEKLPMDQKMNCE